MTSRKRKAVMGDQGGSGFATQGEVKTIIYQV